MGQAVRKGKGGQGVLVLLIDTSAWIEFFKGTEKGAKVRKEIEENTCYVTSESMAEVARWCFESKADVDKRFEEINGLTSSVLYMGRKTERRAGELAVSVNKGRKKRIGLMDCTIAAVAEENDLTVLTADSDFLELGAKAKVIR